jgi:hypothetical protein
LFGKYIKLISLIMHVDKMGNIHCPHTCDCGVYCLLRCEAM